MCFMCSDQHVKCYTSMFMVNVIKTESQSAPYEGQNLIRERKYPKFKSYIAHLNHH